MRPSFASLLAIPRNVTLLHTRQMSQALPRSHWLWAAPVPTARAIRLISAPNRYPKRLVFCKDDHSVHVYHMWRGANRCLSPTSPAADAPGGDLLQLSKGRQMTVALGNVDVVGKAGHWTNEGRVCRKRCAGSTHTSLCGGSARRARVDARLRLFDTAECVGDVT